MSERGELYRQALATENALREEVARLKFELDFVKNQLGVEQEAHRNALESLHRALEHRDDLARQLAEGQKYFVQAEDEWKRRNRSVLDELTKAQEAQATAEKELAAFRNAAITSMNAMGDLVQRVRESAIAAHLNPPEVPR